MEAYKADLDPSPESDVSLVLDSSDPQERYDECIEVAARAARVGEWALKEASALIPHISAKPEAVLEEETEEIPKVLSHLTRRELEMLEALSSGISDYQISRRFWVEKQTVKFHMSNIYRKLGVHNRTQAATIYLRSLSADQLSEYTKDLSELTDKEREILELLRDGLSNTDMASKLRVTEQTVKFHLSNIYQKLEVRSRTEAVRIAIACSAVEASEEPEQEPSIENESVIALATHLFHLAATEISSMQILETRPIPPILTVVEEFKGDTIQETEKETPTPSARERLDKLSFREWEIMALASAGLSNKEISRILWLVEPTVKFHLRNVYQKLSVSNRSEAADIFLDNLERAEFPDA